LVQVLSGVGVMPVLYCTLSESGVPEFVHAADDQSTIFPAFKTVDV
jgi:hypothetical protein